MFSRNCFGKDKNVPENCILKMLYIIYSKRRVVNLLKINEGEKGSLEKIKQIKELCIDLIQVPIYITVLELL